MVTNINTAPGTTNLALLICRHIQTTQHHTIHQHLHKAKHQQQITFRMQGNTHSIFLVIVKIEDKYKFTCDGKVSINVYT